MLTMLPITSVVAAADNVRRRIGDVRDLAASITSVGIVEPLLVSPIDDERYVIVAGHRRHAAAVKAGLTEVPCTIRTLTDAERVEIMLVENLQRADLTPVEEASGYFRLLEHGMTQKELAKRIGRSARHVAARLALLELPKAVQDEVHGGTITVADAQCLLALRAEPEVIERLLADDWNRRDLERAVLREQHRAEVVRQRADEARAGRPGDIDLGRTGEQHESAATRSQATGQEAEDRARAKARNAASEERVSFARSLLGGKVPKRDLWELVGAQLLSDLSATHAKLACRILDIEPVTRSWGPDHRAAIEAFANAAPAKRDRALLATALAVGEERTRYVPTADAALRHVAYLASFGFEASATPIDG